MDTQAHDAIIKRLRSDKVGSVDPVRMQQNMHRAADAMLDMRTALGDAEVDGLHRAATIGELRETIASLEDRIVALTNVSSVKRSK